MDRYFNSENDYSKDEQDINYFPSEYHSHQEIKDVVNSYINKYMNMKKKVYKGCSVWTEQQICISARTN